MLPWVAQELLTLVCSLRRGGVIINEHTLTREQTRSHVELLGRWFDFISLEELPRRLAQPGRRRFCLLTFDDGKLSNATEVAPELERLGVPAVFYVTTGFLSSGQPLWFDRQRALVQALGSCPPGLELCRLKSLPTHQLTERLDQAWAQYGAGIKIDSPHMLPMSWEDARRLSRRGFTIGAHGVTHAILTRLPRQEALAEIQQSLEEVRAALGQPCTTFAFPNGNYNSELVWHARRCGAAEIMTTEPTWVSRFAKLWRLPRVQFFGELQPSRLELKLALAALRGALPNPDGSGRAYWWEYARPAQLEPI